MKRKISIAVKLLLMVFVISSCASSADVASNKLIQKRKHLKGYHISSKQSKFKLKNKNEELLVLEDVDKKTTVHINRELKLNNHTNLETTKESNTISSTKNTDVAIQVKDEKVNHAETAITEKSITKNTTQSTSKKRIRKLNKRKSRSINNLDNSSDDMLILLVILCFLLPPVAVGLKAGWDSKQFIISLILTLLVWVPGVIYSLLVVLDVI